jgi:hypothetical protein
MRTSEISIWFFVGIMLLIYGVMIFLYGMYEVVTGHTAHVVLANLHAPIWWGGFMLVVGLFYCLHFRPARGN